MEQYIIRDTNDIARVMMIVCKKWVLEKASFVDAIRIEELKSSLIDGERK